MAKKMSKKNQGVKPQAGAMASANDIANPVLPNRGLGSAYAQAVENIMAAAEDTSGSKNGFLGEPKRVINHLENLHSSILPKDFDARKKL